MSFGVFKDNPNPFWKDLVLATLPVAIASIGPIIVDYLLGKAEPDNSKATVKEDLKREKSKSDDNDKSG
jgi:hypothetical protein